jgi:hypothetical protein
MDQATPTRFDPSSERVDLALFESAVARCDEHNLFSRKVCLFHIALPEDKAATGPPALSENIRSVRFRLSAID